MHRRATLGTALVLGAAVAAFGSTPSSASSGQRCALLAASPHAAADGTLACVHWVPARDGSGDALVLSVSRDGGKRWAVQPGLLPATHGDQGSAPMAPGVPVGSVPRQLFFSPGFASDHRLYLSLSHGGLLYTEDLGQSWLPGSPPTASFAELESSTYTPYAVGTREVRSYPLALATTIAIDDLSGQGGDHTNIDYRVEPPGAVPAAGSPLLDDSFLAPADPRSTDVFVVAWTGSSEEEQVTSQLFACSADLACRTPRWRGRPDVLYTIAGFSGDYARDHTIYAFGVPRASSGGSADSAANVQPVISNDSGRSFHRWEPVADLAARAGRSGGFMRFTVATDPSWPQTVVLHTVSQCTRNCNDWRPSRSPAYEEIWLSQDSGRSFRRMATGADRRSSARGRAFPWSTRTGPDAAGQRLTLVGRRLFSTLPFSYAAAPVRDGLLWCSLDLGKTWASPCKR